MPDKLNIGILGLGRMGYLYAGTIAQVPGANLYAVADVSEQARARIAAEFDAPHLLSDPQDLLALPDLDGVIIATPTSTHKDLVIAAAKAKKAVFCEKPIALTIADTHAALAAVESAGVPLQIGFMRHFDAAYVRAKEIIDSGQIGRPVTFKSIGRDPFCPNPAFADPSKSGGLIIDMGIHDFDLARWLMQSEVERVSAEGTLMVCDTLRAVGDIDNAVINMRFESGALGNVEVSRNAFYGYDIRTEVLGSEGAVNVGVYQHTPVLLLTRSGAQHDVTPYLMERFGSAYRAQISHFVNSVLSGTSPAVGSKDALASIEIGIAATRSQQEGRPVALNEVRQPVS